MYLYICILTRYCKCVAWINIRNLKRLQIAHILDVAEKGLNISGTFKHELR